MRLNPETQYHLNVKKSLLDADNYELLKEYNYTFSTKEALNEDKHVSIIDSRPLILVPNDVKPLSFALQSMNISQVDTTICNGDIDILSPDYITNKTCISKTLDVHNL
jgi:hypothetical protein